MGSESVEPDVAPAPIRCLFFIEAASSYTGGPQVIVSLAGGFAADQVASVVVTTSETEMTEDMARRGIPHRVLPLPPGVQARQGAALRSSPRELLRLAARTVAYNREVAAVLDEERSQVVLVRNLKGMLLAGFAARLAGLPLIWDIGMEKPSRGLVLGMHFLAFLLATRVVAEGPSVYEHVFPAWLRRLFRSKLTVNRPGLPEAKVARLPAEGPAPQEAGRLRVLCTASISPRKNQAMVLEAAARAGVPGLQVRFAGADEDPAYRRELDDLVAREGLEEVEFLGWRSDPEALLGEADVFVLSSWNEGVPVALLEALHAGVPVIVTRVGGMPDVVEDGVTGAVVAPGDVDGLAGALADVAARPEVHRARAAAARAVARRSFVASAWRERYLRVFRDLVRSAP